MNLNLTDKDIEIKVFQGKKGLAEIKDDWEFVVKTMNQKRYLHLYQWHQSYNNAFGTEENPGYFFLAYQNRSPLAIFPLNKSFKKIYGISFNVLEVPDHDLGDFTFGRPDLHRELMTAFLKHLREETDIVWDYILLPHLLEDSMILSSLNPSNDLFVLKELISKSDYIALRPYEEINNSFSRNFRGNLRKARNKLMQAKKIEFINVKTREELYHGFHEFLDVEAMGWKGELGSKTAIKLRPEVKEFYKGLLDQFSKTGECEINLLKIDDRCIAGQFCLIVDETLYILKIGYNEEYSKLAPGNLLLEHIIQRHYKEKKVKSVSLVTGVKWHADWNPSSYKVFRVWIFSRSFWGIIALLLFKGREKCRFILRHFIKRKQK